MAAKVKFERGAWWVFTHHRGRRKKNRVGPTKADKRRAEKIAEQVNAAIALGQYGTTTNKGERPLPCDAELRKWHRTYAPTMKATYATLTQGLIDNHLAPHFGSSDMRKIREADLLAFVQKMQDAGRAPGTIRNALSALRRVFSLLVRDGQLTANPAAGIGSLMARVERATVAETAEVQSWSRTEVETLLRISRESEPRFSPFLALLLGTGMRRGEALGLQWTDIDLGGSVLTVRRSITTAGLSTPKSGKPRRVALPASLAEMLFDLLADRRRECLARGWPEVPEWVFCSEVGTAWGVRNVSRIWYRVRRRAQKQGVRPLRLHDARHTYASLALHAGKSVKWLADQLGHSNPALTLQIYAHVVPDEETDLGFANFDVPGRPYTAPNSDAHPEAESASSLSDHQRFGFMERETGIEPATLSLGS